MRVDEEDARTRNVGEIYLGSRCPTTMISQPQPAMSTKQSRAENQPQSLGWGEAVCGIRQAEGDKIQADRLVFIPCDRSSFLMGFSISAILAVAVGLLWPLVWNKAIVRRRACFGR